ncbi:putative ArsR family transcriptional regulator [Phycicoccus duodecadis]|uniref:Putative ArsR family transcriptional regulator n=1 Tax=Phycicoccus duodecadis TaxID=173053 RepID=A0A2N3YGY5_9MICO|nr:putative ArsR family transcriptional regulator [Phycicoccus duodecadis]
MITVEKNTGPRPGPGRAPTDAQGRVLAALTRRGAPTTLAQLVEVTGLHENTVRGHLDALHQASHVTRLRARPAGRGRPAWAYVAREAPYAALAQSLARGIEASPGATARETGESGGRAWGERLRAVFDGDERTPRERLLLTLEHVGFGPEPSPDPTVVRLTRCPFLDAARAHPAAVCSVHLGLIEGVLGESLDPHALQPFGEPDACLVRIPSPGTGG